MKCYIGPSYHVMLAQHYAIGRACSNTSRKYIIRPSVAGPNNALVLQDYRLFLVPLMNLTHLRMRIYLACSSMIHLIQLHIAAQLSLSPIKMQLLRFLPCDALRCTVLVIVILSVCLSVRPSDTLVDCVHMVRPTIMIFFTIW